MDWQELHWLHENQVTTIKVALTCMSFCRHVHQIYYFPNLIHMSGLQVYFASPHLLIFYFHLQELDICWDINSTSYNNKLITSSQNTVTTRAEVVFPFLSFPKKSNSNQNLHSKFIWQVVCMVHLALLWFLKNIICTRWNLLKKVSYKLHPEDHK